MNIAFLLLFTFNWMENLFDFYYSDFMVGVRDLAGYFKTDDLLNVSFKPKYTVCRYILKKLLTLY